MAKLKGNHVSKKNQATAYKALMKAGKNKAKKLARHLKAHPNDAQAEGAVKSAPQYTGRTAPKRVGARVNPYGSDRDLMALAEVMIENKQGSREEFTVQPSSLNLLNGRISAKGHRVLQARRFSAGVRAEAAFDRKGKLFPKPKMTKAERDLAKARALGKQAADSGVSKAKQNKLKKGVRKAA